MNEEISVKRLKAGDEAEFERLVQTCEKRVYNLALRYTNNEADAADIAQLIDEEVQRIVSENYERALNIIRENKERLLLIADKLLEYETLTGAQVSELLETGAMSAPPVRELPPELPPEEPEQPHETPEAPTEEPAAGQDTPVDNTPKPTDAPTEQPPTH